MEPKSHTTIISFLISQACSFHLNITSVSQILTLKQVLRLLRFSDHVSLVDVIKDGVMTQLCQLHCHFHIRRFIADYLKL